MGKVPLSAVVEADLEGEAGAARYPFGKCSVRLRVQQGSSMKQCILILQLDTRPESDAFVTLVRAAAKHLRAENRRKKAESASKQVNPPPLETDIASPMGTLEADAVSLFSYGPNSVAQTMGLLKDFALLDSSASQPRLPHAAMTKSKGRSLL
eukprot:NODE_4592_length_658_cov_311.893864.p1 GENE.NODE_4592_length_658_cov_311.893864~~NODE_4592_length_658_cov_311.893864.p1  ORF type:complete len:153 (+),score=40.81 NODE_4592_length_658_cov_311.893864:47-505(+)